MARLRIETAPEITVYDESFVIKAASGASAPLAEFKNSAGTVVGNIAVDGTLNVLSVVASSAGTTSTSLATRGYVDTVAAGLNWHDSVAFATAAALSACTYANGTLGVGATLTGNANGRLTVDGSAQTTGRSILVKDQATATQNGIYTITAQGDGSTPFVLTRRTDSNNSVPGQVSTGDSVYVVGGTNNGGQGFTLTTTGTGTNDAIVFGTDSLSFAQFTGTATFTAGAGLTSTGNVIDVVTASSSRIVVNADNIDLATVSQTNTSGASTTSFVSGHTVDSYGRITATETSSVSFAGYATLASPALTGTPSSTTAANSTNTSQIATTAFVQNAATIAVSDAGNNAVLKSLIDAKGDLVVGTANDTVGRLAAGTNGYFLKANSTATAGIEWASIPTVNTLDDVGDVVITSIANGDLLKYNSSTASWVNAAGYATLESPTFTGTVYGITKTMVGLGSADNTADTAKPVSTAQQTALDLKANLAGPTFTGTVSGITKSMVGLGSADDTADTAKPVSTAQQTALDLKANLASPTFTGVPAAPTAAASTNTTQVATTAFVRAEVAALVGSAPGTLDTLGELATSLANNASLSTTLTDAIALKAPLASPTFTGTVTLPSGTVTSAMILDGTIANADISTTAAIDQGKIADTTINAQAASYTLVLTDKNKLVEVGNASANTLTIPPNGSVAFPVGSTLTILQTGAGQCTLTAGAGVTVNGTPGLKLRTTWSSATLIKRATDTWVALGDLVA